MPESKAKKAKEPEAVSAPDLIAAIQDVASRIPAEVDAYPTFVKSGLMRVHRAAAGLRDSVVQQNRAANARKPGED